MMTARLTGILTDILTGIMTGITTGVTADITLVFTAVELDCYAFFLAGVSTHPHQTYSRAGILVLIYPSTGYC